MSSDIGNNGDRVKILNITMQITTEKYKSIPHIKHNSSNYISDKLMCANRNDNNMIELRYSNVVKTMMMIIIIVILRGQKTFFLVAVMAIKIKKIRE